jgi:hypothetical protein
MGKEGDFILGADCQAYARGSWWHYLFLGSSSGTKGFVALCFWAKEVGSNIKPLLFLPTEPYLYTPYLYTSEA